MANIDSADNLDGVRITDLGSDPSSPNSGQHQLYTKSGGLYIKNSSGTVVGPLGTGSGVSLEVKEGDGSPDVTGVTTIIVPNGTLTDNGSGSITLTTGAGDTVGPGSSTNNDIATFSGSTGKLLQDSGKTLPTGAVVGTTDTQTLSNKTLGNTNALTIKDGSLVVQNTTDTTKQLSLDLSAISTGQTRTLAVIDANATIVGTTNTQTLTNKTLTSPVIATIVNTGTLTLPTSTDTLVGRATTDTLTNKTLTTPTIASLVNATHNHQNSAGGATLIESALVLSNVTTNNVTSTAHGFAPVSPGDATQMLNGAATPAYATPGLLSSTASVNLNTSTATTLYTVPAAKTCVVQNIILRNASTSLTTASISFGFNSASYNNIVANATHTELTGNTLYTELQPKTGATVGNAADVLKCLANTTQGAAATITVDVFGYLF